MPSRTLRAFFAASLPLALFGAALLGQQEHASSGARTQTQAPAAQNPESQGERVFKANCSRCHLAPMSISPRITGTVIMHMRVKARLSKNDEQLLLKYLAP